MRMSEYVDRCPHISTYVHIDRHMSTDLDICQHLLITCRHVSELKQLAICRIRRLRSVLTDASAVAFIAEQKSKNSYLISIHLAFSLFSTR